MLTTIVIKISVPTANYLDVVNQFKYTKKKNEQIFAKIFQL